MYAAIVIADLAILHGLISKRKGGPGSGHRGHAGRPGMVGGSAPGTATGQGPVAEAKDVERKALSAHRSDDELVVLPRGSDMRQVVDAAYDSGVVMGFYHLDRGGISTFQRSGGYTQGIV